MPEKVTTEYDENTGNLILIDKLGRKVAEIHMPITHNRANKKDQQNAPQHNLPPEQ